MAVVIPFRGIHYAPEVGDSLDRVLAPPYDVISPREQAELYAASPSNIARIILNQSEPGDVADATYQRAADTLKEWLQSGVLIEDVSPSYYVYLQEFRHPSTGREYQRTSLVCALELTPYSAGVVLPHEQTRLKAKEDRLKLLRATNCQTEPIMCLYEDDQSGFAAFVDQAIAGQEPMLDATIGGDRHIVYRIDDANGFVSQFFKDRRIWIADGHHRYETSLAFAQEKRAESAAESPLLSDYILVTMTAFNDPGLVVMPTHRLLKDVNPEILDSLQTWLSRDFVWETVSLDELESERSGNPAEGVHRFGVITKELVGVITLRNPDALAHLSQQYGPAWRALDVSLLQELIIDDVFGIPSDKLATTPQIAYTRSIPEAHEKVASGEADVAFLLNDPSADEVRGVAADSDKMPPKSTFFTPKLWSGLLLRRV